jgi:predicted enzyme related to lactoylglutathione lyase
MGAMAAQCQGRTRDPSRLLVWPAWKGHAKLGSGQARSDFISLMQRVAKRENAMANQVVWVDIPVLDLDRAIRFYSAVLGAKVNKEEYPEMAIGLLPGSDPDVTGCLFKSETDRPSSEGPLIYLNADGRLDEAVNHVEAYGGKVLKPRHSIGPYGFRALVLDSEGNRVALHSM